MGCFPFLKEVTVKWKSLRDSKVNSSSHDSRTTKTTDSKNSKSGYRNSGDESCKDVSGSSREKSGVGPSSSSSSSQRRSIPSLYKEKAHNLRVFSLVEMRSATRDFTPELKVGEGGFGPVYKGFIKNGNGSDAQSVVAVKKLNKHGLQGHKEWVAEVQTLGIIDHPNVVKLIGYCAVDDERGIQRMLVYEFMPNRSLDDHLFNKTLPVLPWNTRIILALGTAQGLAYLHEELEVQVIFRDFKASNVLLDDVFNPKLSDFGLAREGPEAGRTHVTTAVMGTAGYAAPEYVQTGHLTSKSDVWSFGVVLYELLTGRRSVEKNRPTNEQKLLAWVKHFPPESRTFHMIVDRRLRNQYSLVAAKKLAKLAESCIQRQSKSRPKMSEVVESLKEVIYISENDKYEPPSSEIVDSDRPVELDNGSNKVVGGVAEQKRRLVQLERMRNARGLNKLRTDIEQQQRK